MPASTSMARDESAARSRARSGVGEVLRSRAFTDGQSIVCASMGNLHGKRRICTTSTITNPLPCPRVPQASSNFRIQPWHAPSKSLSQPLRQDQVSPAQEGTMNTPTDSYSTPNDGAEEYAFRDGKPSQQDVGGTVSLYPIKRAATAPYPDESVSGAEDISGGRVLRANSHPSPGATTRALAVTPPSNAAHYITTAAKTPGNMRGAPPKTREQNGATAVATATSASKEGPLRGMASKRNEFRCIDIRLTRKQQRRHRGSGDGLVHALNGVSASWKGGDLVALVGPSGCGKSSLLNALSLRPFRKGSTLTGKVQLNGQDLSHEHMKKVSGYMAQGDHFLPTQTVSEVLTYHAMMRLPTGTDVAPIVTKLLAQVGMDKMADRRIGGALPGGLVLSGISGGERRRLSLCCTLVTSPAICFIDEATSGLDSLAALKVMRLLRERATNDGTIIVCSIHQPRGDIWDLFDSVLALSLGYVMYHGPTRKAAPWFQSQGYPFPMHTNAADFIMDIINVSFAEKEEADDAEKGDIEARGETPKQGIQLVRQLADAFQGSLTTNVSRSTPYVETEADVFTVLPPEMIAPSSGSSKSALSAAENGNHSGTKGNRLDVSLVIERQSVWGWIKRWLYCFNLIIQRNGRAYLANPGNALARLIVVLFVVALKVASYKGIAASPETREDQFSVLGSLFLTCTALLLIPFCSMSLFIFDRTFVVSESQSGMYPLSAYFAANWVLEAMLNSLNAFVYATISYITIQYQGSYGIYTAILIAYNVVSNNILQLFALLTPNQDIAFALGAGYACIGIVTAGFVVTASNLQAVGAALQWIALPKYVYQALAMNEFGASSLTIDQLQLNRPDSVGANIMIIALGFGSVVALGGFMALRTYVHKPTL